LENPQWYTPYTPYQAEISQGRLESLINYQTMVKDLTGMDFSNASLLDESTAAAEAMTMCYAQAKKKRNVFYVSKDVHPQNIEVIRTRAEPIGVDIQVADYEKMDFSKDNVCGVLIQYPGTEGKIIDYSAFVEKVRKIFCL
jgi:glycine dehydrogenase